MIVSTTTSSHRNRTNQTRPQPPTRKAKISPSFSEIYFERELILLVKRVRPSSSPLTAQLFFFCKSQRKYNFTIAILWGSLEDGYLFTRLIQIECFGMIIYANMEDMHVTITYLQFFNAIGVCWE